MVPDTVTVWSNMVFVIGTKDPPAVGDPHAPMQRIRVRGVCPACRLEHLWWSLRAAGGLTDVVRFGEGDRVEFTRKMLGCPVVTQRCERTARLHEQWHLPR